MKTLAFFRLTFHALFLTFLLTPSVFAQWEPDVRLTYNDSISYTTGYNAWCIAASGDIVHVVWTDWRNWGENVYYKRSTDGGTSWGPDIRFTNNPSCFPSVAASGSYALVVWGSNRDGNDEIYYKRSTNDGTSWGPESRLTYDDSMSGYPSVAVSGSNVHVAWMDTRAGWGIYYKHSTDGGLSWQPDTHLSNVVSGYWPPAPSVAVSGSGVHIVWEDWRDGNDEIYYIHSTDGGTTWGTETRLTNDPSNSLSPSVGVSDSTVHVVWADLWNGFNSKICYKRSTNGGNTWSPGSRLTNDTTISERPSVTASGANVHLVWQDQRDGNDEIYYKRSTNGGLVWETDTRLTNDTAESYFPSVAVSGLRVHVVWTDQRDGNYEIYYKRNPSGNLGVEERGVTSPISPVPFSIAPNPFLPYAIVLGHEGERFMLYDIVGRLVGTYKGDRVGWDVTPGVYFLRPEGRNDRPLRIVKVR